MCWTLTVIIGDNLQLRTRACRSTRTRCERDGTSNQIFDVFQTCARKKRLCLFSRERSLRVSTALNIYCKNQFSLSRTRTRRARDTEPVRMIPLDNQRVTSHKTPTIPLHFRFSPVEFRPSPKRIFRSAFKLLATLSLSERQSDILIKPESQIHASANGSNSRRWHWCTRPSFALTTSLFVSVLRLILRRTPVREQPKSTGQGRR